MATGSAGVARGFQSAEAFSEANRRNAALRKAEDKLEAMQREGFDADALLKECRKLRSKALTNEKDYDQFFLKFTRAMFKAEMPRAEIMEILTDCLGEKKALDVVTKVESEARKQLSTMEVLRKEGRPKHVQQVEGHLEAVTPFFEPKYMLREGKLGESGSAILVGVMPWAWQEVAEQASKQLGIEAIKAKDPAARNQEEKELLALFEAVFSTEENYATYISQADKRKYLEDLIKTSATSPAGTTVVQLSTTSTMRFMAALNSANIGLDELYERVLDSDMTENAKGLFKQQFMTLYMANQDLGEAYLLAVYDSIRNKDFEDRFESRFNQQIKLMRQNWGGSIANYFDALRVGNAFGFDGYETLMTVMYANLCLNSMIIGGMESNTRAHFGRTLAAGFLMGISNATQTMLSQSSQALVNKLKDYGAQDPEALYLVDPTKAALAFSSGLGTKILEGTTEAVNKSLIEPFFKFYTTLCYNLTADIQVAFLTGAQGDEFNTLRNPYNVTASLGLLAIYSMNLQGMRGIENVSMADIAKMDDIQIEAAAAATKHNIIDENVVDLFKGVTKQMLLCKTPEEKHNVVLAAYTVIFSLKINPLEEDEITGWQRAFGYPDIDGGVFKYFKDLSVEEAQQLFLMIVQLRNAGISLSLNELLDMHKDGYKAKDGQKYKGIEALEKYFEDNKDKTGP